jgi:hypothetical protein
VTKFAAFAFAGVAAATLAGTAIAAKPNTHKMEVTLPDGAIARIEYVGDVAPKVTIAPGHVADASAPRSDETPWAMAFPSFAGFDRMIEEMNRRTEELMRRADQIDPKATGPMPHIASYGSLSPGETSTTIVSVTSGGETCTRTTQVISQGEGKGPKVTTKLAGKCNNEAAPRAGSVNPA